jgi:hypothetical protein
MAASLLPQPGSKHGPCAAECKHIDCAETRKMAAAICRFCSRMIDYDRRFYTDPDNPNALVHASCLEDSIEKERRDQRLSEIGHYQRQSVDPQDLTD